MNYNLETVMEAVRTLGRDYPQAVYSPLSDWGRVSGCFYTLGTVRDGPPNQCGCLLGQALIRVNPELRDYLEAEDEYLGSNGPKCIGEICLDLALVQSADTVSKETLWLNEVQIRQDSGDTWSEAIAAADKLVTAGSEEKTI